MELLRVRYSNNFSGYETRPTAAPARYPIIFIHGNSDIGVGNGGSVGWQTGFTTLINYLQDNGGYKKEDLYVTTWGRISFIAKAPQTQILHHRTATRRNS